jgi:hypothetical protein
LRFTGAFFERDAVRLRAAMARQSGRDPFISALSRDASSG